MITWILIGVGAFLLLCAGGGLYYAFRNVLPDILTWAYQTFLPTLIAVLKKRKTPEEEAKDRERWRQGIPPGQNRHER